MKYDSLNLPSTPRVNHIGSVLLTYHKLWIIPVVAGIVLSAVYAVFLRSETWSARQSLIVRDDMLGQSYKPGRFDSLDSLKSAQETILEIARKPQVIRNTLQKLGPEPGGLFNWGAVDESWPSEEVIESVQGAVSLSAPNGAEFGRTEVIILNTKASARERSREFISLLLTEIIVKTNEVRTLRIQSMEAELIQARNSALIALEESKKKLREMDRQLGPDVDAMNALNDEQGSENPLKRDLSQIRLEKRVVQSDIETAKSVLKMLIEARNNPHILVNISNDLIKHQPALEYLKKELVTAQAALSKNKGPYTDIHPLVKSGQAEVDAIQQCIFNELDNSIEGMNNDVAVLEQRAHRLNQEIEKLDARLVNLGENRADFLTLRSEVNQRDEIVNKTQRDLAEVQGLASSADANLLTPVDEPQVATRPDEMSKKATVLAGALGGLMLGLGLVMLVAPPMDPADPAHQATEPSNAATPPTPVQETVTVELSSPPDGIPDLTDPPVKQKQSEQPKKGPIQVVPVKRVPVEHAPVPSVSVSGDSFPSAPVPSSSISGESVPSAPVSGDSVPSVSVPSVSVPSVSVPPVQRQSETPLQPIARKKPQGEAAKVVVSSDKLASLFEQSADPIEVPVPSPTPVTDQASSPESIVDQAFELPIDVDNTATNPTQTPETSQDAKVVDLEIPSPAKPSPAKPLMTERSSKKEKKRVNRGRPAIIVKRTQPNMDLHRRQPSVRPIELVKSVESQVQDSTGTLAPETSDEQKPKSEAQPESTRDSNPTFTWEENPFLEADRKSSTSVEEKPPLEEPEKKDEVDLPVPEQIKRLSETIANFARPVAKPPSEDLDNTSF